MIENSLVEDPRGFLLVYIYISNAAYTYIYAINLIDLQSVNFYSIRSKVWGGEGGGGRWKKSEWEEKIVGGLLTLPREGIAVL